jgi:uncharacterized protein YdhG (YjbR/CyaY superfamily)
MAVRFASVEEYVASFPADVQAVLEEVRDTIVRAVPDAGEKISYQIPTVTVDGSALLYYAGWKEHISIYPLPEGDAELDAALAPYISGASTAKFPLAEPIPYDLVARIARQHLANRTSG